MNTSSAITWVRIPDSAAGLRLSRRGAEVLGGGVRATSVKRSVRMDGTL